MDSARGALSIVVLDACRDNPFAGSRGGARGLTVVGNAPAGAIIVYATDPGKTAQDGSGRNGTFTEAFLHHVGTPGLDVKDLFDRVGKEVAQKTRGEQTPWISSKFYDTFSLSGTVVPSTAPPPVTGNPLAEPEGLVLVPAGSFQMGSAQGDADEKPARAVTISRGFYMSRYEVTQEQWQEVMGTKPAGQEVEDLPMANVSWYEAVEYCNRLSRREGLRPCYKGSGESVSCDFSANGYRLPTEAEWEYAARGGNRSRGYTFAGGDSPEEVAWHQNDAGARVHPVGQKKPNELGLYDLSGNLYEWCWDWYGSYAAAMSPDGPRTGSRRVLRGGGWASTAESLRVTNRGYDTPEYKSKYVGFRPVRNAE
jgi:formylglycine-generating enzyme required for sulfatase activity